MLTNINHSNSQLILFLASISLAVALTGCSACFNETTFHEADSSMLADWEYSKIPAQIKFNTVLELMFTNENKTGNPFDYNSISLSAIFTDASGKDYHVDGSTMAN